MRVLVVGSGAREHALCWALARSAQVFCTPGNPGTAQLGTNLPVRPDDHQGITEAIRAHQIDLTVIGPEAPLAAGLTDHLAAAGHSAFGPTAAAAQIESSKAFAKDLMLAAGVPTPASATFRDQSRALDYIRAHAEPLVVKASGLAAGKGAIVCETRTHAEAAVRQMFGGAFGEAGKVVLVEEFLEGEEVSVLALTDGERTLVLPPSQDHKRIGERDTGPNTGGMGAYTPVSIADDALMDRVDREILEPTLRALLQRGTPYTGVLYAGLMIDDAGDLSVLEFNCRFGDPEAQVVLPASDLDLAPHAWAIAAAERWSPETSRCRAARAAVTTVLASHGYPTSARTGDPITLPDELPPRTLLFHAGTATDGHGTLRTAGGRVLSATGLGRDVPEAAERSRALAESVTFAGRQLRRDIAWREVARAGAS